MKPELEFRFSDPKEWWAGQKLALGGEICVSIHTRLCAAASIPCDVLCHSQQLNTVSTV